MIPNCKGCKEELAIAIDEQDNNNLYFATTKENNFGLGTKGHLHINMINDKGELVIWID